MLLLAARTRRIERIERADELGDQPDDRCRFTLVEHLRRAGQAQRSAGLRQTRKQRAPLLLALDADAAELFLDIGRK